MKTEKVLASLLIIGVLFKFMHWPGTGPILVFSGGILAMMYYPLGFYYFTEKETRKKNIILSVVSGMFWSTVIVGLIFKLQFYPGSGVMAIIGGYGSFVILGVITFMKSQKGEEQKLYFDSMWKRALVMAGIGLFLLSVSSESIMKFNYRNEPELGRLRIQMMNHPENEQYQKEYEEYKAKRDSIFWENEKNQ